MSRHAKLRRARDRRAGVALHMAGQAVVASALGMRINNLGLEELSEKSTRGGFQWEPCQPFPRYYKAAISVAGEIAQSINAARGTGAWRGVSRLGPKASAELEASVRKQGIPDAEISLGRECAGTVLAERWGDVLQLADALLLHKGAIPGEALAALLRGSETGRPL